MVGSSHRSPSPLTSRSTSFETNQTQPIRKSFNIPSNLTNPTKFTSSTPVNSPAEIGGRNYVGGEEKENEKAQAQFLIASAKLRSPSNKSKNFMAPTISAAIKFTPSPRKRILVDRNDPVRTSITLSDGKATFFSSVSSDLTSCFDKNRDVFRSEEKNNEGVQEVPIVPKPLKKVTFKEVKGNTSSLAQSCIEKVPIFSNSEDIIDNSSAELSNISVPCPPHEPEDNIISGAKFDVGKVNFRGSNSGEIKQLEDSCMCELSENLPFSEVFDQQSQTVDSQERLKEDVSESLPLSTPIGDAITEDSVVPKKAMKPRPLGNWKSVCLIVALLGAFMLSATYFTTMHSFVPKDLPELAGVAETAKVNLDEFGGKVKQWSVDSISYLYKMVPSVLGVDKIGGLQFMNLTVLDDDYRISSFFDVNSKGKEFEEYMGLELEDVEEEEDEDEMEDVEEEEDEDEMEEVDGAMKEVEHETEEVEDEIEEVEDERKEEAEPLHTELKMDTSEDDQLLAETEKPHVEQEIVSSVATRKLINQQSSLDMVSIPESPDTTNAKLDASEIDHNSPSSGTEIQLEEHQYCSSVESRKLEGDHESFSDVSYTHETSQTPKGSESSSGESKFQANIVILGASLGLLGLGTVALFIYINQLRKMVSTYGDANPICNKIEFKAPKAPSNEDVVGESCSSEMSISHRSSSSYQMKSESFVHSGEYSFGSPSYGSFTTYETIPIKHAGRDEEIVTPVRRSSRIRKQVTSQ